MAPVVRSRALAGRHGGVNLLDLGGNVGCRRRRDRSPSVGSGPPRGGERAANGFVGWSDDLHQHRPGDGHSHLHGPAARPGPGAGAPRPAAAVIAPAPAPDAGGPARPALAPHHHSVPAGGGARHRPVWTAGPAGPAAAAHRHVLDDWRCGQGGVQRHLHRSGLGHPEQRVRGRCRRRRAGERRCPLRGARRGGIGEGGVLRPAHPVLRTGPPITAVARPVLRPRAAGSPPGQEGCGGGPRHTSMRAPPSGERPVER